MNAGPGLVPGDHVAASPRQIRAAGERVIEVVAGVIRDPRGRVLLARRTEGRDLAGRWEFPGGKREPGETAEAALARELREELGIDVDVGPRLISVPQVYPDKRLLLDVREISAWRGTARGLEAQALAWVPLPKLARYAMPPADRPVVAALLHPDRYLVTPEPGDPARWLAALDRALASGIRCVQLRARAMERDAWTRLARDAVLRCRVAGASVLINGDVELALSLQAGVHLRAAQLMALDRRPPMPDAVPLAASCHDIAELRAAEALGCDFAVVGTLKTSASHPGVAGIGWDGFVALREQASLPIYAIGGLTADDVPESRRHGAQGIAAIRGFWPDPA